MKYLGFFIPMVMDSLGEGFASTLTCISILPTFTVAATDRRVHLLISQKALGDAPILKTTL